jgi:hypothetical protein
MPVEQALGLGAHGSHIIESSSDNYVPITQYNNLINYDNENQNYNHKQLNNKGSYYSLQKEKEKKHNTILKNLELQSAVERLNDYWKTGRDRLMKKCQ